MSSWAKLTGNAELRHTLAATPPNDYWGQVDVWIPPDTFTACRDSDLFGQTAEFLYVVVDGLLAFDDNYPHGDWLWTSARGSDGATGPSPSTTYTIEFHYVSSGGSAHVDWYVNSTLVLTSTGVFTTPSPTIILNRFSEGCCCEVYYYTNVKVSTTRGAGDLFSDDFSAGLGNWANIGTGFPNAVAIVAAPTAAPCPTITFSPTSGQAGDTFTLSGSGFAADSPLTLVWGNVLIESFAATTDGSGDFSVTVTVPEGVGAAEFGVATYSLFVTDDEGNVGCNSGEFSICGTRPSDGITTAPDPWLVRDGGSTVAGENVVLDYIFHDDAHWILWQDYSVTDGFFGGNLTTFPPPANHTMNATRISADGSSVTDYPIDSNYWWTFGAGNDFNTGGGSRNCRTGGSSVSAPVWSETVFFQSWAKPIYDARFASDGTTLWVGLVTRETVEYPWLDNLDAVPGFNPGALNQFLTLASWTSGFTNFPTNTGTGRAIFHTETDGSLNFWQPQAFPVTDSGEHNVGYWSPPCVAIYSFDGSAFNRIGTIDALYCPGVTQGYDNGLSGIIGVPLLNHDGPRGQLFSRIALAASPDDPGVLHAVWSEGGPWGRAGLDNGVDCHRLVWDSGPINQSYRVNYSTWDSAGQLTSNDISSSHVDRTNWFFTAADPSNPTGSAFPTGYTWPDQADFGGSLDFDARDDNAAGTPYWFATILQSIQNATLIPNDSHGNPWLDNTLVGGDTLHVYDLTGGSATLKQSVDLATLGPTEAELEALWPNLIGSFEALGPADCVIWPPVFESGDLVTSYEGDVGKSFGISLPYDDPTLGVPVYLVHVPLAKRYLTVPPTEINPGFNSQSGPNARSFYRVPCDMSAAFDYLDGDRQINFTIVKFPLGPDFGSGDFFSDPKNIWVPDNGSSGSFGQFLGLWLDRICLNLWETFPTAWTPDVSHYWTGSICPGFYYDPDADSITTVALSPDIDLSGPASSPLFAVTTQFICRGCRSCTCGTGIRVAQRV